MQATKRVLAAPGKMIIPVSASGRVLRRKVRTDDGGSGSVAIYISDSGLYDARLRTVIKPGPVEVPDDARTKRLIADGDLIVSSAETPEIKPAQMSPRKARSAADSE